MYAITWPARVVCRCDMVHAITWPARVVCRGEKNVSTAVVLHTQFLHCLTFSELLYSTWYFNQNKYSENDLSNLHLN